MYDNKIKKWYHFTCFESSEIAFCTEAEACSDYDSNEYGPFDTFTECRQDAIEYHRTTKLTAENAIFELRNLKKKDFK